MGVDPPLNNFMGPEGDTVTVAEQLLNTEYCRHGSDGDSEGRMTANLSTPTSAPPTPP